MNDGEIITDQFEILAETKHFYEELYSCKDTQLTYINLHDLFKDVEVKNIKDLYSMKNLHKY